MLYCSLKAAKKERIKYNSFWRVSRVAAINIDVRADVARTAVWRGHRWAWPESGRLSCYPVKLYQRTVLCSLGDFFFPFIFLSIKRITEATEEVSGTLWKENRGSQHPRTHAATSNQSVFYMYFKKKRSKTMTPVWTLSTWRSLDGRPLTTAPPLGTERLFHPLDWLYTNTTWDNTSRRKKCFVFTTCVFLHPQSQPIKDWQQQQQPDFDSFLLLFFFPSNICVLLCVVLWWPRTLRLFCAPCRH